MVLAEQLQDEKVRKATILLIDDKPDSLKPILDQLGKEGFDNVKSHGNYSSFKEITDQKPAVAMLDIHGVGEHLDEKLHGLALLDYIRDRLPFTRVIIYSGHDKFDLNAQAILQKAHRRIKKGSVSLKDLICVFQEEAVAFYDPYIQKEELVKLIRNKQLDERIDSWWSHFRFNRTLLKTEKLQKDASLQEYMKLFGKLMKYGKTVAELAGVVKAIIEIFK